MTIIKNETEFYLPEKTVVTIGKFDGFHRGHQKLLNEMKQVAGQYGWKTVVFTFATPPQIVLQQKNDGFLMTDEEKEIFLQQHGVDYLIEYPFNEFTRSMEAEVFMEQVLHRQLHSSMIVTGTDFRFGKDRKGNPIFLKQYMKQYNCQVEIVEKAVDDMLNQEISSTFVRELVKKGDMKSAKRLMGHAYFFFGKVIHGRGLAHKLGFPTMNIEIPAEKLVPPYGVYSASAILEGKEYNGILNIGCKPTITDEKKLLLELFLFHYDEDTYGKKIQIMLHSFVRREMKFASVAALRERVLEDAKFVQQDADEREKEIQ